MLTHPRVQQLGALILPRLELVVLVAVALGAFALPGRAVGGRTVPVGILVIALSQAGSLALLAAGLVLVYRSNRIINFAQGALGAASGYLFYNVVVHRELLHLLGNIGLPVGDNVFTAGYPWQVLNFVVAGLAALLIALLVGLLAYFVVIRWFQKAPPLTVTVATIGMSYLVTTLLQLPQLQAIWPADNATSFQMPFDVILTVGPVTLHMLDVAAIVIGPLVLAGLGLYLRRSRIGIALRASSANADRAKTLGMPVATVTSVAWILAALLSGVASILLAASSNNSGTGVGGQSGASNGFPADLLVTVLAVAVVARMRSLPLVMVGAVCLAVTEQSLVWNLNSSALFQVFLLGLIVVFLLVRREQRGRVDVAEETFAAAREARPTPPVLRVFPTVRNLRWLLWAVAAITLVLFPWVAPPATIEGATVAIVYAMIGLSLLVLTGWAGQISLGQFAFAGIGAYMAALLGGTAGMPMFLAVIVGAVAGALLATVIGLPALRLPGLNLAVVTLAVAIATTAVLLNPNYLGHFLPTKLNRPGLLGLDGEDPHVYFYLILVLLAAVALSVMGLRRSRLARALIASRDNPYAAQSFGVSLFAARLKAFAISGFIAALAGGLFAYEQHGVHTESFTADSNLLQFLTAVTGGLGSVIGPMLGAAVGFVLPLLNLPVISTAGIPVLALVLLLFYPSGLSGIAFGLRDVVLRRVATRHRIDVPSLLRGSVADRRHARAPLAPRKQDATLAEEAPYRITAQWTYAGSGAGDGEP